MPEKIKLLQYMGVSLFFRLLHPFFWFQVKIIESPNIDLLNSFVFLFCFFFFFFFFVVANSSITSLQKLSGNRETFSHLN